MSAPKRWPWESEPGVKRVSRYRTPASGRSAKIVARPPEPDQAKAQGTEYERYLVAGRRDGYSDRELMTPEQFAAYQFRNPQTGELDTVRLLAAQGELEQKLSTSQEIAAAPNPSSIVLPQRIVPAVPTSTSQE
jgi:hypothetical protein